MQILALHGFTGRGSDFAPFAKLCGGEWRCPDLPGHGNEQPLDCSPQATAAYIQQQIPSLGAPVGTDKKLLLGYSMGARAALLHACQDPQAWDALILISPNPGIENERERSQRRCADNDLADAIETQGVPAFLEFWQNTPMIRSQQNISSEWRNAMQASRRQHNAIGLANSLRQFGQGAVMNLWPHISRLKMPILLITGQQDSKYSEIAQRMRSLSAPPLDLPWQHRIIEGAGHAPHLEAPEASAQLVRQFLQALES